MLIQNRDISGYIMYTHEWHFYDLSRKKTIVTIVDTKNYNTGDGKRHNGKNYRVIAKITGTTGKKLAILLAIEV